MEDSKLEITKRDLVVLFAILAANLVVVVAVLHYGIKLALFIGRSFL